MFVKKSIKFWSPKLTIALILFFGTGMPGCFPSDEGVSNASLNLSIADMGVSASAVSDWLNWRAQDNNQVNYDLGVTGNDFYLGLHILNAELIYGDKFTYDTTQNVLTANIYVQKCDLCAFKATLYTVKANDNVTLAPARQVNTFYGKSPLFTLSRQPVTVDMNVEQVSAGQVYCKPVNDPPNGYALAAVDPDEGVRFPSAIRTNGSADSGVTLSNIPKGWIMDIQVLKEGTSEFQPATKDGNQIQVLIPDKVDFVSDCVFDMP